MTDSELDNWKRRTTVEVQQLHQALSSATGVTDPSAAMHTIFAGDSALATKLHRIFALAHDSKDALKLRAPRPAQRPAGEERGFQALGPMLGTKLDAAQEAGAREAIEARQRSPRATARSHNELAAAAAAHLRQRSQRGE